MIAPGGVGSVGNLTIGSLLTASNLTTLNFDLTTPGGSNDLLMVTGKNLTWLPTRPSRSAPTRPRLAITV